MQNPRRPFGFAIGVISLALAITAPLVASIPNTPGPVLILPALLGALVALVLGSWRLALLTVWLCATGSAGFSSLGGSPYGREPNPLVTTAVFLIGAAIAVPLGINYARARAARTQQHLPEAKGKTRKRLGVSVGSLSVLFALIALSTDISVRSGFRMLFFGPQTDFTSGNTVLYAIVPGMMYAPVFGLMSLLGAMMAIVCGAWRTAALAIYLATPTLLVFVSVPLGHVEQQVLYPLMGLAALSAFLLWHYQQSRRHKESSTPQDT